MVPSNMWRVEVESRDENRQQYWRWYSDDLPLQFDEFLSGIESEESLRKIFLQQLRQTPYRALRWETPPLTRSNLRQAFECVIHEASELDVQAERADFESHFSAQPVVSFDNLGSDARLVVPCPLDSSTNYSHLAAFVRSARPEQQHQLLIRLAVELRSALGEQPLWLNTAGGGVDRLHIRIDQWPKYYRYQPFRNWPS